MRTSNSLISRRSPGLNLLLAVGLGAVAAAGCKPRTVGGDVKTSDVPQSSVKEQPMANCWIYAFAAMVESMALQAGVKDVNLSESYWVYWFFFDQITGNKDLIAVDDHGSYDIAIRLVEKYGYADEADFFDDIASEHSIAKAAFAQINRDLAEGPLATPAARQDKALVQARLNEAFKLPAGRIEAIRKDAGKLVVRGRREGSTVTLADILFTPPHAFTFLQYPERPKSGQVDPATQKTRDKVLRVVKQALNWHYPVIMSFTNDHNSYDTATQTYKYNGPSEEKSADGGGHQVLLRDYATVGGPGEGEVSEDQKARALDLELAHFLAKNSWGPGWGEKGFMRYSRSFLDGYPKRVDKNGNEFRVTNLQGFVVPSAALNTYAQVTKQIYTSAENVEIVYAGFTGAPSDWISIHRIEGSKVTEVRSYKTEGAREGRITHGKLPAGEYELRAGYAGLASAFVKVRFRVDKAGWFQ